jgi:uncharacterized membrane protein
MAYTFNTELKSIAATYIELLQGKVTVDTIKKDIEANPYYPSLLALSDTFGRYNITNEAFKVSTKDFDQLASDTPFVAFTKIPSIGTDFVLITKISEQSISYFHKNKKVETVPKEEFLQRYKEVIWKAQLNEQSGDADYEKKHQEEKTEQNKKIAWISTAILGLFLIIVANISHENTFSIVSITFLKIIGVITSCLLLAYEVDKNNPFVKNICSIGGQSNCDAVLSSKAAKIGGISWGEIGFFYFIATTLGLLMPNLSYEVKVTCLAIANILAVPYIFFSIYYQWRIIKQWCPLCLTIQFILASELIWSVFTVWQYPFINILQAPILLFILFCVFIPVISWYALKSIITKAKDHDLYLSAYKRLQYNPDIFNSLLHQQSQAPHGWQELGIDIGNPNAKNIIIKVCNPYCVPCEKSHIELENILKYNKDIKLKVIFITRNSDFDKGSFVVKHLLAIAAEGNMSKTESALDDWYLNVEKDYDLFATKYPMNGQLKAQAAKIEAMSKWCDITDVTHTPTIFINGFRLPESYKIEELKYIL